MLKHFFRAKLLKRCLILAALPSVLATPVVADLGGLEAPLKPAMALLAEKRYEAAYKALLPHAGDNHLAQFNLGLFEMYGWGRDVNPGAACEWFEKSAAEDVPAAQVFLGDCYRRGDHRPASFAVAKGWYLKAVENGLQLGNFELCRLLLSGELAEKNIAEGLERCKVAAANGTLPAQLYLAERYYRGDLGVPQDSKLALEWYQAAAVSDVPEALYFVAKILKGAKADFSKALKSAEKAAERGYSPAYLLTGELYMQAPLDPERQLPTPENLAKAYLWIQASLRVDPEQQIAKKHLIKIRSVMPKTWEPSLDKKIDRHFAGLKPSV